MKISSHVSIDSQTWKTDVRTQDMLRKASKQVRTPGEGALVGVSSALVVWYRSRWRTMSFIFSIFVMRFLDSESVLMLSRPVVDEMVLMLLVDSARCLYREDVCEQFTGPDPKWAMSPVRGCFGVRERWRVVDIDGHSRSEDDDGSDTILGERVHIRARHA